MFGHKTQPAWFFDSTVHLEAVNRLLYLVESHEPLGLICGTDGSGRTRVLSKLREELARSGTSVISMNLSGLDEESAFWQLASRVSAGTRPDMKRHELLILVRDELRGLGHCGVQNVILLDDFQRSLGDQSVLLRILLALTAQCQGLLTVIVASDKPLSAEFAQHSFIHVSLSPLDRSESADFVRTLLRRKSIRPSAIEDSAVRVISEMATGNAARMSRICELLRVLHQASPETRINAETVRSLLDELLPGTDSKAG